MYIEDHNLVTTLLRKSSKLGRRSISLSLKVLEYSLKIVDIKFQIDKVFKLKRYVKLRFKGGS